MAKEVNEILYAVRLDVQSTLEGLKQFTGAANAATKASTELKDSQVQSEDAAKRQEAASKKTTEAVKAEEGSIAALRESNKKLTAERNATTTATEQGRKKIADLNAQLDSNNKVIKENVDAYTKQKIGIGGYTDALDKLVPGLGATMNGLNGMKTAALAFIATPLGAILGALGLAVGALIAYFKGSEEGQNKWNKVLSVGGVLLEKLMDVAEGAGEILVGLFEHPLESLQQFGSFLTSQIINRFVGMLELVPKLGMAVGLLFEGKFSEAGKVAGDAVGKVVLGVENATELVTNFAKDVASTVDEAVKAGSRMADMQAKLDKLDRQLIVEREKTNLEVLQRRTEAIQLEGEAKYNAIQEAIILEQELSDKEVEMAQVRANLAAETVKQKGADKEALKELAQANAAVIAAESTRYSNTLKMEKELEKLRDDNKKEEEKRQKVMQAVAESVAAAKTAAAKKQLDEAAALGVQGMDNIIANAKKEEAIYDEGRKTLLQKAKDFFSEYGQIAKGLLDGIFSAIQGHYQNQENALAVSLANQKTQLQTEYASELAILQAKYDSGEMSKEEYDKGVMALNQKYQADVKAAEIEQSKALNAIKEKEFNANKKSSIASALISAASAIIMCFAQLGPIAGAIAAGITAGLTAIQIKQIKNQEFVPATFFEGGHATQGGYTGKGNPRSESKRLGTKWYTYHKDEYVTPSRVLNTPEGLFYVNKLETLRTKGRNSFSSSGFADGGFAQNFETQQAMTAISMSETNRLLERMVNKSTQPVLVLQDFESVQSTRDTVQTKADLA